MSKEISCVDLLKQQDELIKEAASILPLKSDKCTCTRKRQLIYSCLTCFDKYKTPIVRLKLTNRGFVTLVISVVILHIILSLLMLRLLLVIVLGSLVL